MDAAWMDYPACSSAIEAAVLTWGTPSKESDSCSDPRGQVLMLLSKLTMV